MDINTTVQTEFLSNHTNLVAIGIVIMIITTLIFYNLYEDSKYDRNGRKLSVKNTFKNMCGIYPLINNTLNRSVKAVKETTENIVKKIRRKKEVFNIDNNAFTYKQARKVCKAYGANLATYNQVSTAHRKGANWCNYGWSANKMALYPIQDAFHKDIESNPKTKGNCGKPGVNGGRFENLDMKFGVNCYGYRPKGNEDQLVYNTDPIYKEIVKTEKNNKDNMHKYKRLVRDNVIEIRPYNDQKWSRYSHKKSKYILSPKDPLNIIIEDTLNDDEKDPRNANINNDSSEDKSTNEFSNLNSDIVDRIVIKIKNDSKHPFSKYTVGQLKKVIETDLTDEQKKAFKSYYEQIYTNLLDNYKKNNTTNVTKSEFIGPKKTKFRVNQWEEFNIVLGKINSDSLTPEEIVRAQRHLGIISMKLPNLLKK
jgi:hypothetical protein